MSVRQKMLCLLMIALIASAASENKAKSPDGPPTSIAVEVPNVDFEQMNPERVNVAYNNWREVLIRGLLVKGLAKSGHGLGIFTALLAEAVTLYSKGGEKSIWTQIKSKVEGTVGREFTKEAFGPRMQVALRDFYALSKKKEKFDGQDLAYILNRQPYFFPQDQETSQYSDGYVAAIKAWMYYVTAGFLDLQSAGKIPKCSLANELKKLRPDMIDAAKSLYRKKYTDQDGFDWQWAKYRDGLGYQHWHRVISYMDRATGEKCKAELRYVRNSCFTPMKDKVKLAVMMFIHDYNDYLNGLVEEGCEKPNRIEDEEVTFPWEGDCLGRGRKGNCVIPCDYYDYGSKWCETNTDKAKRMTTPWTSCDPPVWNECLPVKVTSVAAFITDMKKRKRGDIHHPNNEGDGSGDES